MKKMNKIIYIILSLSILSVIACDRYIESRDPIRSLPNDVPVPNNVNIFVNNLSVTLNWEISNASSITRYRVYTSQNDTLNYVLKDSTTALSITLDNLISNRLYYFKVSAVSESGLEGYLSEELFAQVGLLNMVISSNAEFTSRTSVQVQFTVSNSVTHVQLSEDSTFANTEYEPFSGQQNFTISDGDGMKTVYAKLLFTNGASNNVPLRDSIILDTKAQIDSVFFLTPNNTFRPADTIVFGIIATELQGTARVTFNNSTTIQLVDDGTRFDVTANDGIYNGWYVVPNNTHVFEATVSGNFTDEAGNKATALNSFDLLNINTRPQPVELLVSYTPGDSARFSWTLSNEPDFESYRIYTANNSNVITSDNLVHYEPMVNNRATAYMPAQGTTYYRIFVFDAHGESRASDNFVQIIRP